MSTSPGTHRSNASFSGALTDVWPATVAPGLQDGPYALTTAARAADSTEKMSRSASRATACPFGRGVMLVSAVVSGVDGQGGGD